MTSLTGWFEFLGRTPDAEGRAKVVFHPDSGDPVAIVAGDPAAALGSPEHKGVVECLWDIFGGSTTEQGYRVLHPRVGLIYGDSITLGTGRSASWRRWRPRGSRRATWCSALARTRTSM